VGHDIRGEKYTGVGGGGGMVPVAQSILADAFPPEKRGQGFALFGVAVVVGPVVGPTLGGWLADNFSWRWAFMINAPVGLITMALIALVLHEPEAAAAQRRRLRRRGDRFDAVGFALVASGGQSMVRTTRNRAFPAIIFA
jgi:DHA2 family multidrug resistance protein